MLPLPSDRRCGDDENPIIIQMNIAPLWGGKRDLDGQKPNGHQAIAHPSRRELALAGGLNENTCVQMQRQKCRFVHSVRLVWSAITLVSV